MAVRTRLTSRLAIKPFHACCISVLDLSLQPLYLSSPNVRAPSVVTLHSPRRSFAPSGSPEKAASECWLGHMHRESDIIERKRTTANRGQCSMGPMNECMHD
uniref:Uncharacterized protein n=1 Tax=Arundo donax TaxID=35708 RepID=A0A0A9ALC1_ARUDO